MVELLDRLRHGHRVGHREEEHVDLSILFEGRHVDGVPVQLVFVELVFARDEYDAHLVRELDSLR